MSLVLRPATEADKPALRALLREFMDYLNAIEPGEPVADERIAMLTDLAFGPDRLVNSLVAERDGRLVAELAWTIGIFEVFKALQVVSLFVTASERASGVGKALMEKAQELALEHGAERVWWTVWRQNPKAIAFYETIGGKSFDEEMLMVLEPRRMGGG
ncbi:GNAT superfamily N-acetyltransferase [Rhodoligotrophos appendicifer]|uniref:GNAT family N-acetyltransferase n=1 Tax=Rhodoligotrophos appendicifer TaxID=987056 RepID=UPI0011866534|nr:GNAT family N-acetyltransferase [Rhodoligotrophos appendicifer]